MSRYNPKEVEPKWRERWETDKVFETTADKARPKYYVLEMFPYPSGRIHIGHVRNYAMGDVVARYKRARGFNVLHPMGWDAFGMPAENAAMATGGHPEDWTRGNIEIMRGQLKQMGLSIDWSRELATCDPEYYQHEQKLFLDFWKKGFVERKESQVNWDPVDHTVLANEQVIDGKGWRSGASVERKTLSQWFLKITDMADDLLDALDDGRLKGWPENVRLMQRNWIGKSKGLKMKFHFADGTNPPANFDGLEIYTTRPDTLFGASFCAVAPDHPLAQHFSQSSKEVESFIAECQAAGTSEEAIEKAEKKGMALPLEVKHPFIEGKTLPVYIANFILMQYGTGAIFGCPAHDQRDLDFVRKYGLDVIPVVLPPNADPATFTIDDEPYVGPGTLFNSDFLNGMSVEDALAAAIAKIEEMGQGEATTNYRLRDWGGLPPTLLGMPDPGDPLRELRGCSCAGRGPSRHLTEGGGGRIQNTGQSARTRRRLAERPLPQMRKARPARDGYVRHVHGLKLVFRPLRRRARRQAGGQRGSRLLAAGRSIYRRHRTCDLASSLCALFHKDDERDRAPLSQRTI